MSSREATATLNGYGFQMATPCPLVQEWISSYDNIHPLLDVGCAFGINTFEALERNIPTIAMDMDERHLDSIRNNLSPRCKSLATCVFGVLPQNVPVPDNSLSGILVSEVFQFLNEREMEETMIILHRKLVEGGKLVLSTLSDKLLAYTVTNDNQDLFYQRLKNGEKWPGMIPLNEEFLGILSKHMKSDYMKSNFLTHLPEVLQVFSQKQMADALEGVGFEIKISQYSRHLGYPDADGIRNLEGINLQVVAEKKQIN